MSAIDADAPTLLTSASPDALVLLEVVVVALRPQAEAQGIALMLRASETAARVCTDRRMVDQIVLNLASNAIKFTGRCHVRMTLLQGSAAAAGGSEIRTEGSSLGLHPRQKLAALLGGKVVCRSQPGLGSTFTLVLPGH